MIPQCVTDKCPDVPKCPLMNDAVPSRELLPRAQVSVQAAARQHSEGDVSRVSCRDTCNGARGVWGQSPKGRWAAGGGTRPGGKGSCQAPRAVARHGHAASPPGTHGTSWTSLPGQIAQRDTVQRGKQKRTSSLSSPPHRTPEIQQDVRSALEAPRSPFV